jgi:hypothetical protein
VPQVSIPEPWNPELFFRRPKSSTLHSIECKVRFLYVFCSLSFSAITVRTVNFVTHFDVGRAMAQAVSRRPSTAEARVRSVSPCGICGGQSGTGTGFSPSTSVFPCQFHSTGDPLLGKMKKKLITFHLHHRVAQEVLRLRCVPSFCCGALLHKKKHILTLLNKGFYRLIMSIIWKFPIYKRYSPAVPKKSARWDNFGDRVRKISQTLWQACCTSKVETRYPKYVTKYSYQRITEVTNLL